MTDWKISFDDGVANFKRKKYREAIELFTEAINAQSPGHMALESRAAAYEQIEEFKEALLDCRTLMKLFPDRHNGYTRASKILLKMKEYNRALDIARTGLSRIGDDPKGRVRLEASLDAALIAQANEGPQSNSSESYISGLPLELLVLIFEELVESRQMSPVKLSHVCRHWRQAILGMTKMWSRLVLSSDWKKIRARTSAWMDRSHGRLVELKVKSSGCLIQWLDQYGKGAARSVDYIWFDFDGDNLPPRFFLDANPASLYWRAKCSDSSPLLLPLRPRGKGVFRLQELTVIGIPIKWETVSKQLKDLSRLVIRGEKISCSHLFNILEQSTSIVTLHVDVIHESDFDRTNRLCLQNLVELKLIKGNAVVKYLELPGLKVLELSRMDAEAALDDLLPLDPTLTSLNIGRCMNFPEEPRLLPLTLASLSLTGLAAKPDAWIEAITQGACPSLAQLDVSATKVGTGCLVRLVRARNETKQTGESSLTPLETLTMNECQEFSAEFLPWIRSKVPLVSCVYERKIKR